MVGRFVVGTNDLDGSGFIDRDDEVECENAYWEVPEVSEAFAVKDIVKVLPLVTNNNMNLPCVLSAPVGNSPSHIDRHSSLTPTLRFGQAC